jgi:hypothetical protein
VEIDLLGWEDTLPGVGRPQAIINRVHALFFRRLSV